MRIQEPKYKKLVKFFSTNNNPNNIFNNITYTGITLMKEAILVWLKLLHLKE